VTTQGCLSPTFAKLLHNSHRRASLRRDGRRRWAARLALSLADDLDAGHPSAQRCRDHAAGEQPTPHDSATARGTPCCHTSANVYHTSHAYRHPRQHHRRAAANPPVKPPGRERQRHTQRRIRCRASTPSPSSNRTALGHYAFHVAASHCTEEDGMSIGALAGTVSEKSLLVRSRGHYAFLTLLVFGPSASAAIFFF